MTGRHRRLAPETVQGLIRDTRPWLSCDDCFHLLDQYVEALLADPDTDQPAMHAHLAGCSACADEAVSLLLLAARDAGVDPAMALRRLPAT